jgi:hypothetical protein
MQDSFFNALYYALAVNFLFMLPFYDTTPRYETGYYSGNEFQSNLLAMKPFNCIYCLTFWIAVVGSLIIPFMSDDSLSFANVRPIVCAPVLAVLIQKTIKALPTVI